MAVNSISPGSYNSPSIQPQAQVVEKKDLPQQQEVKQQTSPVEGAAPTPTVNTSGQVVGSIVNIKA